MEEGALPPCPPSLREGGKKGIWGFGWRLRASQIPRPLVAEGGGVPEKWAGLRLTNQESWK